MEHRLGWKHEYWDGAAQLSIQGSAVVDWEISVASSVAPPRVPGELRLRDVAIEDEKELIRLFTETFADSPEFTGWPDDAYCQNAEECVRSFLDLPIDRLGHRRTPGMPEASQLIEHSSEIVAAILLRRERRGPIIEPIMVDPRYQRQGLGAALLSAVLLRLQGADHPFLYSSTYLANAASLSWHQKHGFREIVNHLSALHRWRHFAWLADHHEHFGRTGQADQMRELATHWKGIANRLEESRPNIQTG